MESIFPQAVVIKYCKFIRNKTGRYPKVLHTDNGKEFVDKCTSAFNKKKGITHTFTSPHSSLQNPIAERINRTTVTGSPDVIDLSSASANFSPSLSSVTMFASLLCK